MLSFIRHHAWAAIFIPWLLLAAGCTITASDVEPALPDGQIEGSSTLAYYSNGRPVVANNSSSLISILVAVFGDSRAVAGQLRGGTQLSLRAVDDQSAAYAGGKYHALRLTLSGFHGLGTYPLDAQSTYYQELTPRASGQSVPPDPTFYVVTTAPAEVIITGWDAATRHVRGMFVLAVATAPGAPAVALTDGRFDLILD
ncbi:hypothetical protein [Hymenobacter coccineus]|uniref:Uncharacterized protein n=1 Tax=Hymenobacter coccineus TaxID=1908235 RepID=A0A1G1T490_9BACT|nr:hypothetical protein [Hymenobacter coccineus]OGX85691.1 hypothetical protein BEN49_11035 [Hymenobacter coccineus]